MPTIRDLQRDVHMMAVDKGFYDEPRSFGDCIALMHSELSEALEAYRERGRVETMLVDGKPEGAAPELADCVIRIMDTCEFYGIDLGAEIERKVAYNAGRSYRHGGKAL